ncbi:MAG: ribosomal RNA small subunit methyltransferase A [Myxococcales bacterium]|nr:ribosomal RNA small subunit methyltransferase A [Myxococcales bacterium]
MGADAGIAPISRAGVRGFLERHGLRPNPRLGQNFLVDATMAERLAAAAGVSPDDTVVEIGPGLGQLTLALAKRARRVVAIEVDAGLVRALRSEALLPDNVELVHGDVLDVDLEAIVASVEGPVRLVANLPYSVTGPLLRCVFDLREALEDWSVMVQSEVADRLVATAGTRDYSSLTVLHHSAVRVDRKLGISPNHFYPVPKVRSSFLRLTPIDDPIVTPAEMAGFEIVVRAAFSTRRKTLANALRGGLDPPVAAEDVRAALAAAGVDAGVRAEVLTAPQFATFVAELRTRGWRPRADGRSGAEA